MGVTKIGKKFPNFAEAQFVSNCSADHFCTAENLQPIVCSRFEKVFLHTRCDPSERDVVHFGGRWDNVASSLSANQSAYFLCEEIPVTINTRRQLGGSLPNGEIDFFIGRINFGPNVSSADDPDSGERGIRLPFKAATYFPLKNVLFLRSFLLGDREESVLEFIRWVFDKVAKIEYRTTKRGEKLMIGADPEFHLYSSDDEFISADTYFATVSRDGREDPPIGCDGCSSTAELRPSPKYDPLELTEEVGRLFAEVAGIIGPSIKVITGGGTASSPAGHHIHFNKMLCPEEKRLMDIFVGFPSLKIKNAQRPEGSSERYGNPNHPDSLRAQPHGCEYRVPPGCLIPELCAALHTTAFCVVKKWEEMNDGEELSIQIDDDTGIPTLGSYKMLDTSPTRKYTPHLEEFWRWAVGQKEMEKNRDVLWRWVPNRNEVKTVYFVKLIWPSNILPRTTKPERIELPYLKSRKEVTIFLVEDSEETSETENSTETLNIIIPEQHMEKIDKTAFRNLYRSYGIDKVRGLYSSTFHIGLEKATINRLRLSTKIISFVTETCKILFPEE